jgi:hypothetical protein
VGGGVALVASFVLVPTWLGDWIGAVRSDPGVHLIPFLLPGGFLLALAVLRWRQPEARTLLVMSAVPQTMTYYDPLPVILCARTFRESLILALLSQIAMVSDLLYVRTFQSMAMMFREGATFALRLIYVPALVMVLLRPRAGKSEASDSPSV